LTIAEWRTYLNRRTAACLDAKEALAQAHHLGDIADRMRFYQQYPEYTHKGLGCPPLRGLLIALSVAQKFVHFTTFGGISHLLIGTLKVTAQRVAVRGVVSGSRGEGSLTEATVSELTNYCDEAPDMDVKIYPSSLNGWSKMPHQKLIVIDGLLAFKGAANLTLSGWRKAAHDRDIVEVVTEIDQMIGLHNRLFASVWAELSDIGETVRVTRLDLMLPSR
jgi:hypothetical protein